MSEGEGDGVRGVKPGRRGTRCHFAGASEALVGGLGGAGGEAFEVLGCGRGLMGAG